MSRWIRVWGPAALQMAVIFAASSIPNLQRLPADISDKTGHFSGYGLLGAFAVRALSGASWAGVTPGVAVRAVAWCAFYGMTDEWHQRFVPGRTAAVDDWVADVLGAGAAVIILTALAGVLRRWRREV